MGREMRKKQMKIIHLSLGGPTKSIRNGNQVVYYEMSRFCGPMPCTKDGDGRNLKPNHWFWKAITEELNRS